MDSLGVGVDEVRCIYAPDCQQCCQEAPKHLPDNTGIVLVFFGNIFAEEGALVPPLFVPSCPTGLGNLKKQEPHWWSLPFACFGACCAPEPIGSLHHVGG